MTEQIPEPIQKAREAFRAGEVARGGVLIHRVLQQEIGNQAAWRLLFEYIGKGQTFEDFQRDFAEKYYPDLIDQLEAASDAPAPFRRVSLVEGQERTLDEPSTGMLDFPRPKTGPLPEPRQIEEKPPPLRKSISSRLFPRKTETDNERSEGRGFGLLRRMIAGLKKRFPRARTNQAASKPRKAAPEQEPQDPAPAGIAERPATMGTGIALLGLNKNRPTETVDEVPPEPARREEGDRSLARGLGERSGIRVLIADDIDHTREMIRKLLLFEPSVDVVGVAANGTEAVARAAELEPDIVLLDINMPDMDGLQALRLIRDSLPITQVIMLTVQDDPGYLREALQSGARDYLIKPPMIDDLLETIHNAYAIGKAEHERLERRSRDQDEIPDSQARGIPGQAIAVFSPKGGVGCTLIAANLAAALHSHGSPAVLVDCDLQFGSVGLFFNEIGRNSVVDLAVLGRGLDRKSVRDTVVRHPDTGVDLLLAPGRAAKPGAVTGAQLAELILFLRTIYGYVIVDTPSPVDDITLSVMEASDQVLLVTTQDIPAINDVRKMMDLAPRAGIDPDKISLVLNQYHPRVKISPEQIAANLRTTFAAVIPLDSQTAIPSINRGVPFMTDPAAQSRPIGKSIQELVAHVVLEPASGPSD